ncbi:Gfo/Idh/MocA family oxidoreductase [Rhodocytophaga aerolata]|uniref:Gfo/Idh/MocA family oxidoreductase n=1 Tax=Rhodocytophaga aerolata TaxID=455078 RepID=A0ABT8RFU6_9BACT|nr:Gfo/Idh/MocA family oxidoreductase [Rhodocytophaga aerolata]MDO1450974.1 Gfo/Idh/MocA family oxidoreductase [Rhodocytophaga aerolata]
MKAQKHITRKDFLLQASMLGVATALTPATLQATSPPIADKKIRVGVIGCGSVSNMYLPHLSKSAYVELVSTCDIIVERAAKAAQKYSIPNQYPSIEKMLAGVPFDLLVNLTDMQEHGRLNKIALEAGKHVWSEKPLANTYAEGKALLKLATQKGIRIWGAPAVVNSPQFAFMAKAIQGGKLGKIAAAHGHYGHLGPEWSAFFYEENGGSMPDLAVYNLASITGLLGPVKSVVAMLNVITPTRKVENRPNPVKVEAEDNAMILMEHASGVLSHVQSGFNYFDPYGHEGKGQEKPTISIVGTSGNMHLIGYDWAPFGVDMATKEQEQTTRHVTDAKTYVWQEGASVIAECMATGKEPFIQAEHSLHVLEIIEAARESQASGRRISLQSTFKWPIAV